MMDSWSTATDEAGVREPKGGIRPLRKGDILCGEHLIEREIGRGGMGIVYEAIQLSLQRRVAVKVLGSPGAESSDSDARFRCEAQAMARLEESDCIPAIHQLGRTEGGQPFIVMEYLEGSDVGRALRRRGVFPPEEVVQLSLKICEALRIAHSNGIVHRDLKPSNLFLVNHDSMQVKLLDFGIAQVCENSAEKAVTSASRLFGSLPYMAPEQLCSDAKEDARCDVWALGVTIYQMLTGHLPFNGRTREELVFAIRAHRPTPPSSHREGLSPELDRLVLRCLEKDPQKRVLNMEQLSRELRAVPLARSGKQGRTQRSRQAPDVSSETTANSGRALDTSDHPTASALESTAQLQKLVLAAPSKGWPSTPIIAAGLVLSIAVLAVLLGRLTIASPLSATPAPVGPSTPNVENVITSKPVQVLGTATASSRATASSDAGGGYRPPHVKKPLEPTPADTPKLVPTSDHPPAHPSTEVAPVNSTPQDRRIDMLLN